MGKSPEPGQGGIITSDSLRRRTPRWSLLVIVAAVVVVAGVSYYSYTSRPWTGLGWFGTSSPGGQISSPTPAQAIQQAQDAVANAQTPHDKAVAYIALGDAQVSNSQASAAASSYKSAVDTAPDTKQKSAALGDLAGAYILAGQTQQAIDAINQLIPLLRQSSSAEDQALVPRYQQLIIQLQIGQASQ